MEPASAADGGRARADARPRSTADSPRSRRHSTRSTPVLPSLEGRFHNLYLEYFHKAEAHRRWNVLNDVPWDQIGRSPDPNVVRVVQAFMAVEMYLPDYTSKILHL